MNAGQKKRRYRNRKIAPQPWLTPPVPAGYWDDIRNRRRYLRWLGARLGFTKPRDWLRLSTNDLKRNQAGGAMVRWNHSAVAAVKELYPELEWHEWLFETAPSRFWKDRRNHRRYLDWLAKQLDIRRHEDWYRVTNADFANHAGGAFLLEYASTVSRALITCFPENDLKEWLFDTCPRDFWRSRANRRRYLRWLAEQLGYRRPSDWYGLTYEILKQHHGQGLARSFSDSMMAIVTELYPRRVWHEWLFARVPDGFWKKPKNRRAYLDWLGKKLRFRCPEDWHRLRNWHLKRNGGGAIWTAVDSLQTLLAEYLPEEFKGTKRHLCPLHKEDFLSWADAHFQSTGKWPTKRSGRIPGTNETWSKVDAALRMGMRGWPGGSSLSKLLTGERGTRRWPLPTLSEAMVREWIVRWHRRTGTWPHPMSGPIPASDGETWAAVSSAMSQGRRGFSKGNTLGRLVNVVRQHTEPA